MSLPPAALLAGGLGTRIRTVSGNTPKVLLPVAGRPFLAHLLDYLAASGVSRVVLCTGHGAEQVWDAAQTHAPEGLSLVESRETSALGTGGAIHHALAHLGGTFFIVNGDTYLPASLAPLHQLHQREQAVVTLTLVRSEEAVEKGSVRMAPDGRVLDFSEKVPDGTGLINGGIYMAEAALLAPCPSGVSCSLERTLIPDLVAEGARVFARITEAPFVDIGLPEDYLRVRNQLPGSGGTR